MKDNQNSPLETAQSATPINLDEVAGHFDGLVSLMPEGEVALRGETADKKKLPVQWAQTRDRGSWIRAVETLVRQGAVNICGGGNLRTGRPDNSYAFGGADLVPAASTVFVDVDLGKEGGYAQTVEEADAAMLKVEAAIGLPRAFVNRTPGGLHYHYVLSKPVEPLVIKAIGRTVERLLTELGVKIDVGTTRDTVRLPRIAGTPHQKAGDPVRLVTNLVPTTTPVDPESLRYDALPAARSRKAADGPSLGMLLSEKWPMADILKDHGLTLSGNNWSGQWRTNSRNHSCLASQGEAAGTVIVWSESMAFDLGVQVGGRATSLDFLISQAVRSGAPAADATWIGCAIAEGVLTSDNDMAPLLRYLGGSPSLDQLKIMAKEVTPPWPEKLSAAHRSHVEYRGANSRWTVSRGTHSLKWNEQGQQVLAAKGVSVQALNWLDAMGAPDEVLVYPVRLLGEGRESFTVRAGWTGLAPELPGHAVDATHASEARLADTAIPLVIASAGREFACNDDAPDADLANPVPEPDGRSAGMAQSVTDALMRFSSTVGLKLAPLGVASWLSLLTPAGWNGHREARLAGPLTSLALAGRDVYLVGREDWRREPGLVDVAAGLQELGAIVHVIDTPMRRRSPRVVKNLGGTYTLADALTSENWSLRKLMSDALDYDAAKLEATPTGDSDQQMVDRLERALTTHPRFAYDPDAQRWLRDAGTHLEACQPPLDWAWKVLERSADDSGRLGWEAGGTSQSSRRVKGLLDGLAARTSIQRPATQALDVPLDGNGDGVVTDIQQWLLFCGNGAVDLRTGELRPRRLGENNRRWTPVNFNPEAKAPRFMKFLNELFHGHEDAEECVAWLQAALGPGASGDNLEKLLVLVGAGGDGKSLLASAISGALGSYAVALPPEVLLGGANRFDSIRWRGARFAVASELEKGAVLDAAALKRLVGRDKVPGEIKGGGHVDFVQTHSAIMLTNHLPVLRDTTASMRRRIIVVECLLALGAADRDVTLPAQLAAEREGILAWIVEGARLHYETLKSSRKLLLEQTLPASIERTTSDYFLNSDVLQRFVEEMVDANPAYRREVPRPTFQHDFAEWMTKRENGRPWRSSSVGEALARRGVGKRKSNGTVFYTGLGDAFRTEGPTVLPASSVRQIGAA